MHVQLGATFQAVVFTKVDKDESLRKLVEKSFEDNPHDPTAATAEWSKTCICVDRGIDGAAENASGGGLQLDVPKLDLFSELSSDCVDRMVSIGNFFCLCSQLVLNHVCCFLGIQQRTKQGKTAWKARKGAMEEVDNILKRCSGLLDTSGLRAYLELCRELCDRLSDTQSNLKPVAARLLGSLLSSVGATAQSKLGKIAYAPLINSAMNENKKIMHDAAMEALCVGTSLHVLEGGGMNRQAIVTFVTALAIELDKSEYKVSLVLRVTVFFHSPLFLISLIFDFEIG
jgi:cytoskeleton-associated protein 5